MAGTDSSEVHSNINFSNCAGTFFTGMTGLCYGDDPRALHRYPSQPNSSMFTHNFSMIIVRLAFNFCFEIVFEYMKTIFGYACPFCTFFAVVSSDRGQRAKQSVQKVCRRSIRSSAVFSFSPFCQILAAVRAGIQIFNTSLILTLSHINFDTHILTLLFNLPK